MKMKLLPGIIALILISYAYESSAEVLLQGSNTVSALSIQGEGPGTGIDCGKYTVTLTGGTNSNVLAGVLTQANVDIIDDEWSGYETVAAAENGVRSRLLSGSECTFTDSATCSKVVLLSPSETYWAGVANKGSTSQDYTYSIETCTEAEKAAVSSTFKLNVIAGLFSATLVALTLA